MMMYVWKEYYQRQAGAEKSFGKCYLQFLPVFPDWVYTYMYGYQLPQFANSYTIIILEHSVFFLSF